MTGYLGGPPTLAALGSSSPRVSRPGWREPAPRQGPRATSTARAFSPRCAHSSSFSTSAGSATTPASAPSRRPSCRRSQGVTTRHETCSTRRSSWNARARLDLREPPRSYRLRTVRRSALQPLSRICPEDGGLKRPRRRSPSRQGNNPSVPCCHRAGCAKSLPRRLPLRRGTRRAMLSRTQRPIRRFVRAACATSGAARASPKSVTPHAAPFLRHPPAGRGGYLRTIQELLGTPRCRRRSATRRRCRRLAAVYRSPIRGRKVDFRPARQNPSELGFGRVVGVTSGSCSRRARA